jgi:hypothetical protein
MHYFANSDNTALFICSCCRRALWLKVTEFMPDGKPVFPVPAGWSVTIITHEELYWQCPPCMRSN